MRFHTTILQGGKTATGIQVPAEVVESLGKGKRPPVKVTLNGYTYRSTIAVMDGVYMVGVSADVRQAAGVAGGDELDVDIELDTEPREVAVPEDLAAALDADPQAKAFFQTLSYRRKSAHVQPIAQAKTQETRQRRIEKSVAMFHEGRS